MTKLSALDQGRKAFARSAWGDASTQLSAADQRTSLAPEDLELLAIAAFLTGKDRASAEIRTRAHHGFLDRDEPERAARCAFWLGMELMNKGEMAQAGGWFARSRGLIEDGRDCVEQGYVLVPSALQSLFGGDPAGAHETFVHVARIAERFGDPDLMALSRLGRGRSLIGRGETKQGVALLDEAMVAVTAGEVSPTVAGIVYCATIEACHQAFDVRRAHEWTDALSRWIESQPDLVPFRGLCQVHRAELMQFRGAWGDALREAQHARDRLSEPPDPAVGAAWFRLAELHRLQGEFDKAEEAYREASRWGRSPQPGLALMRLAQGHLDAAEPAIRVVADEAQDLVSRSQILPAYIEIMLEANDLTAARDASDELSTIAEQLGAPLFRAVATHWNGAVLLVEGDARGAIAALRRAWEAWHEVEAPYEAARVRVLIGLACRELGDEDTARMELDAARRVFAQLGAGPVAARVEELLGKAAPKAAGGLTAREVEVLGLLASGKTNRAIADALVISEKTVARHVSNIFTKLGLSSRSAATAYAYEHDLV